MPALHVRNVPEPLYKKLRVRASREGRSINGEAIAILEEALANPSPSELRNVLSRVRRGRKVGLREALALRHDYIGTEHVLLALLRQGDGLAATILHDAGLEYESTREAVL